MLFCNKNILIMKKDLFDKIVKIIFLLLLAAAIRLGYLALETWQDTSRYISGVSNLIFDTSTEEYIAPEGHIR